MAAAQHAKGVQISREQHAMSHPLQLCSIQSMAVGPCMYPDKGQQPSSLLRSPGNYIPSSCMLSHRLPG